MQTVMPAPSFFVLAALVTAGCSSSSPAPPQAVGGVHLVGTNGAEFAPGFEIVTGNILQDGRQDPNVDFYLSLTTIISLVPPTLSAGLGGFCLMPGIFPSVADIPQDSLGTCTWALADLGGNAPHSRSQHAGQGFLVKNRVGVFAAKLLVVGDTADNAGRAEVVFYIGPPSP